jgi:RloB-like protein
MRHRDRTKRPLRGLPVKEPRRRILVVCEGEVTEKEYLDAFCKHVRNPLVDVEISGLGADPVTVVRAARDRKRDGDVAARSDANLAYDDVWCCFDVDDFGKKVAEARTMAKDNGLRLAMSNPCFELWLLLHHRDSPGAIARTALAKLLRKAQPDVVDKHVDFAQLASSYEAAVRRATKLDTDAIAAGEANRNPTTEVYRLTEAIDDAGRAKRATAAAGRGLRDATSRAKRQAAEDRAAAQARNEE